MMVNDTEVRVSKKSKKGPIIITLVAVILIVVGIYIGYFQNNKRIIGKAIDNINTKITKNLLMNYKDINFDDNYTLDTTIDFNFKSDLLQQLATTSNEYLKYYKIFNNINNIKSKMVLKQNKKDQKLFIDLQSNYNNEELIKYKYLIENNTEYYYVKGFMDNYINNGTNSYFETLTSSNTSKENIKYIYDFVLTSFKNNLKKEYFTKSGEKILINNKEKTLQKVTLEINNKRLLEIAQNILNNLKQDTKANQILTGIDKDFKKLKIKNNEQILSKDETIKLSVYVDNLSYAIKKYKLDILNGNNIITITYEDNDIGILNIYKNNTLVDNITITYNESDITMNINDNSQKKIGTIKITTKDNDYNINVKTVKNGTIYDINFNQKIANGKEKNSYDIKSKLSITMKSSNQEVASFNINVNGLLTNNVKIEENTDNAIFARNIDLEKQKQLQQIINNVIIKLMS